MRLPIQVAFTHPRRLTAPLEPFDFTWPHTLQFEPPDTARFPALDLAQLNLMEGGSMTAVFNAANEVAVERFCAGEINFPEITAMPFRMLTGSKLP
jgi:1-deoxy-D-xylulose-5-phosphate reductoisomerase